MLAKRLYPTLPRPRTTRHHQSHHTPANTDRAQALLRLGNQLTHITTREQAIDWALRLNRFHDLYGDWLKDRTYRNQVTDKEIPKHVRDNQQWWYTHPRARRAYRRFERLYCSDHRFSNAMVRIE